MITAMRLKNAEKRKREGGNQEVGEAGTHLPGAPADPRFSQTAVLHACFQSNRNKKMKRNMSWV